MILHRVEPARSALTREEMQKRGNHLSGQARVAAIDAVRASMHSEFLESGKSLTVADIRRWRGRAREAIAAWRLVESLTTELLNEVERTRIIKAPPIERGTRND